MDRQVSVPNWDAPTMWHQSDETGIFAGIPEVWAALCRFGVQTAIYEIHCLQWGAVSFSAGDFSTVVLLLSLASNVVSLWFCGVFWFFWGWGGVWMGVGFVVFWVLFHCFALGNFGKSVDEKCNLVVFLSSISRASRFCSIPSWPERMGTC